MTFAVEVPECGSLRTRRSWAVGASYRQPDTGAPWSVREIAPEYVVEASSPAPGYVPGADFADVTLDDRALTEMGEEIMTLAEQMSAMKRRLLALIARFDRLAGWKLHGFSSCAEWLAFSTGMKKITAREHVRVARALESLPAIGAAMSRGEISFAQARAITRVADEENELELLGHTRSMNADGLERLVRSWKRVCREDEVEQERRRHASRFLSVFPDDDGMCTVRGRIDPEVGALFMRAIEAASDALYQGSVPETTPEQRRADALALLVERAMAMGFGGADEGSDASGPARSPSLPGPRAERYTVVLHVDEATLREEGESGRSHLEDGTRVSAETSRRIACDANVVRVMTGEEATATRGSVTAEPQRSDTAPAPHIGPRTRTVSRSLRRALEIRDCGCRFPGCGSRFTDAHHIRHWADGGPTSLDNLVLLCKVHHRLLHEGGFTLRVDPARPGFPRFFTSRGIEIPRVAPRMGVNGRALPGDQLAQYLRVMEALS